MNHNCAAVFKRGVGCIVVSHTGRLAAGIGNDLIRDSCPRRRHVVDHHGNQVAWEQHAWYGNKPLAEGPLLKIAEGLRAVG